jgi:predicted MPP superfamily phosphohydrolase
VRTDPARVNLLLSHVPAFDHQRLDGRTDLILCGHTHGGQVRLPFLPPLYLPRFSGRFVEGMFRVGPHATPLYVTRGIGTSLFPVRFLCPPEITLLRLQAA